MMMEPRFFLAKDGERTVKLCVVCVCFLRGMDPPHTKLKKTHSTCFWLFFFPGHPTACPKSPSPAGGKKGCLYTTLYPYLKNKTSFLRGVLMFFLTP